MAVIQYGEAFHSTFGVTDQHFLMDACRGLDVNVRSMMRRQTAIRTDHGGCSCRRVSSLSTVACIYEVVVPVEVMRLAVRHAGHWVLSIELWLCGCRVCHVGYATAVDRCMGGKV